MARRKRCTGLQRSLKFYSEAYQIPLSTINNIRRRHHPLLLDCPAKLLRILLEQPGPRVNLVELERIVAAKIAAGLTTK
jgi:hypothetical protein